MDFLLNSDQLEDQFLAGIGLPIIGLVFFYFAVRVSKGKSRVGWPNPPEMTAMILYFGGAFALVGGLINLVHALWIYSRQ